MIEKAIEKICQQQKCIEDTAAYCVGEQLKDIIRTAPGAAELVFKDLDVKEMSIIECEKKIKALANRRHNKNRLQTDEIKEFENEWLEYVKGVSNGKLRSKAS